MKRKVLIGLAVVAALLASFILYANLVLNKRSPAHSVAFSQGGLDFSLTYHRPYKKGRLIFGEKAAGALVPFGQYWRLGANESTEITFPRKVSFAGKPALAGTYRMYAIPGPQTWQVVLNSELGKWGAFEPDRSKDVLVVEVPAEAAAGETEQFTISAAAAPPGAQLEFLWDKTAVHVPIALL
jgi:Protein of unknown function (DUF2911)